jgi:hypothetical protein
MNDMTDVIIILVLFIFLSLGGIVRLYVFGSLTWKETIKTIIITYLIFLLFFIIYYIFRYIAY